MQSDDICAAEKRLERRVLNSHLSGFLTGEGVMGNYPAPKSTGIGAEYGADLTSTYHSNSPAM